MVDGFSVRIVNEETDLVAGKAAVDKHIVSAVVDTAVKVLDGEDVGKLVELAPIRDVDARAASLDVAIGRDDGTGRVVARVVAGDTAARKGGDVAFRQRSNHLLVQRKVSFTLHLHL